MRISNIAASAALGFAALGLSACATGLNTQVSRYQAAAITPGQTFYVVPASGAADPGFARYAAMASQQLEAQGFRPAGAPQLADLLVRMDYSVDRGHTVIERDPFYGSNYGPFGYGGYGGGFGRYGGGFGRYGGWGSPYYSRWGDPFYYGWNDPYWWARPSFGYPGSYGVQTHVEFKSFLDMNIARRADNAQLFQGHVEARSQSPNLDRLVPPLITAMFTGFPGRSGETVRITVPTR